MIKGPCGCTNRSCPFKIVIYQCDNCYYGTEKIAQYESHIALCQRFKLSGHCFKPHDCSWRADQHIIYCYDCKEWLSMEYFPEKCEGED